MAKKEFGCAGNISVIIPYAELEKMLLSARKIDEMEATIRRMDQRCAAMQLMYSEVLGKLHELNRNL